MKKNLYITAAVCLLTMSLQAQQQTLYSQYHQNAFLINPAVAGTLDNPEFSTVMRDQWTGLAGAPKTSSLSFNSGVEGKNIGLGGYVFSDKLGPVSKTGLNFSYAYHLTTGKESMLSFGLSGLFYLYKLNTSQLVFDNNSNTDNVLLTGNFKAYTPNMGAGIYYHSPKFWGGISVPEVISSKISASQDFFVVQERQHYFINVGTTLKISDNATVDPSLLIKFVKGAPAQIDANVNVNFQKMFYVGVSYRSSAAFVGMFGVKIKEMFKLGYAYDVTLSGLSPYTKGTHELMLAYILIKKKTEEQPKTDSQPDTTSPQDNQPQPDNK